MIVESGDVCNRDEKTAHAGVAGIPD